MFGFVTEQAKSGLIDAEDFSGYGIQDEDDVHVFFIHGAELFFGMPEGFFVLLAQDGCADDVCRGFERFQLHSLPGALAFAVIEPDESPPGGGGENGHHGERQNALGRQAGLFLFRQIFGIAVNDFLTAQDLGPARGTARIGRVLQIRIVDLRGSSLRAPFKALAHAQFAFPVEMIFKNIDAVHIGGITENGEHFVDVGLVERAVDKLLSGVVDGFQNSVMAADVLFGPFAEYFAGEGGGDGVEDGNERLEVIGFVEGVEDDGSQGLIRGFDRDGKNRAGAESIENALPVFLVLLDIGAPERLTGSGDDSGKREVVVEAVFRGNNDVFIGSLHGDSLTFRIIQGDGGIRIRHSGGEIAGDLQECFVEVVG